MTQNSNVSFLEKKAFSKIKEKFSNNNLAFEVILPSKNKYRMGKGKKLDFTVDIKNNKGLRACSTFKRLPICESYVFGDVDFNGDMMRLLDLKIDYEDNYPVFNFFRLLKHKFSGQQKADKKAISTHYDFDDDFYLYFMDKNRIYSHGFFEKDTESLETATKRKVDYAINSTRLKKGMKLLDIGGGWAGITEYAGKKGIKVTSLTISKASYNFVANIIKKEKLPCKVLLENFLDHNKKEEYDAIVNLGVIEHLPDYKAVVAQYYKLLKKGGRVYMDGSAAKYKGFSSVFISKYIYPGNHCSWSVHDFLAEVQNSNMEIISLDNDRNSYYLTVKHWAKNLEKREKDIVKRWSQYLYRKFHLYLWGVAHCLKNNSMQAYHCVLEKPKD